MSAIRRTGDRRAEIIGKVADVLREERESATSIESAVDRAGIDRDEINATFGSMRVLILEMVSDLSGSLVLPLEDYSADRSVRDVLTDFGNRLANAYSVSHLIALYRTALAEATRHSGLGREFFERGHGRLTMCLAQYLEYHARRVSPSRTGDSRRIADNFLSLLGDNLESSDAMAPARSTLPNERCAVVSEAVDLFLSRHYYRKTVMHDSHRQKAPFVHG